MKEINLYQIDDVLTKSIAPLLLKIMDEKNKALIYCEDKNILNEIDNSLWSYGKNKFIPHATIKDKNLERFGFDRQPIFLTNEEENPNSANYLITLNNTSSNFVKNFSRIFYFYNKDNEKLVLEFSKNFQKVNSYKKINGKWVS